ncbi:hypothetical protein [Microbacterium sp. NPDC077486]|uniref:hypothetical protein n=1 Tax=Microbacterium sp. NPDC077486 TaxID=3154766 RepID=UPI00341546EC
MTSDSDDALSWDGDDSAEQRPWDAARRSTPAAPEPTPAEAVAPSASAPASGDEETAAPSGLSNAMLVLVGVVGGVYLLYTVGWIAGGLRLQPLASFLVADFMFLPWFVLAIAAPALWFLATWVLTRGRASWIRAAVLLAGVVLLVPWPFVTVGVIGA